MKSKITQASLHYMMDMRVGDADDDDSAFHELILETYVLYLPTRHLS